MAKILIIDDDTSVCHMISRIARKEGHEAVAVQTLEDGMDALCADVFDCVFLDVFLPDGNGLEHITDITTRPAPPEVIIITGYGDPDGAEMAITSGAWNYIEKSATVDQYSLVLDQVVKYRGRRGELKPLELKREGLVGDSPAVGKVLASVAQVAGSKANVLILGETGTGKEIVARAIHANSGAAKGRFVAVDCAAMPKTLVESILFGHARGAFTGANMPQEGLVKMADGGTLFLDEVGELPLTMQKTFLRVLQERCYRPIGSKSEETSDFRLLAATNRDLEAMCTEGTFRLDFLYRLKTFTIYTPPLRVRLEDIPSLSLFHVARICETNGVPVKGIAPEVLDVFRGYDWPGNVRELVNTLERMCVATESPMLYIEHLPVELRARVVRQSLRQQEGARETGLPEETDHAVWTDLGGGAFPTFKEFRQSVVAKADKTYLVRLMERADGSIKRACELAGLSRTRLYYLMQEHNVTKRPT